MDLAGLWRMAGTLLRRTGSMERLPPTARRGSHVRSLFPLRAGETLKAQTKLVVYEDLESFKRIAAQGSVRGLKES